MKKKFCCDIMKDSITNYYKTQAGSGVGFYSGSRSQRGHGFADIFGSLFRSALPVLKTVGSQALKTGARLASDWSEGRNMTEAVNARLKEGVSDGINSLVNNGSTSEQRGCGLGRSYKRKRRSKKVRQSKKKKHDDIFN
jgi:hypothetical protein